MNTLQLLLLLLVDVNMCDNVNDMYRYIKCEVIDLRA